MTDSVKHSVDKQAGMTKNRFLAKPMQSLREAYGCSMILHPVRHLELSTYKGTKNVRETSDIVQTKWGINISNSL